MATSADLIVLGAGPAGLAAAWRAARRGLSVVVLERADRVGGMAGSFEVAGIRVDHGSHRLHPATPPYILDDLRTLLRGDLQLRPRNGRLRLASRWVGFPLRPAELLRALPPSFLARAGAEAILGPARRGAPTSYADALRRSLGPTLYEAMYAPYAVKLWGVPGDALDVEQARRRVAADTPWKIAARMVRRRPDGSGRVFYYPRRGFGQIVDALADAAVAAGADIRLGATVDDVVPQLDQVSVGTSSGPSISGGHVFTTIPLPVLARICRPGPSVAAVEAASRLRFRAMVLVYGAHEGGRWTPYDAHYLPGIDTPVTRISEPANYRVSADDPRSRTVICAEIPCAVGDETWRASDDDLAKFVVDAADRTGLPRPSVADVRVVRLPHVYPVYEVGYRRHIDGLDAWAQSLPRVTTFGRLGLFVHDNTHHALAMAYDAVDALRDGRFDDAAWTAARARFAAHVVED